jgi:Domain of unknown function (DUF3127)
MEIKGTIKLIQGTVQVSEKFSKRIVVVSTRDEYPQHLSIEFNNDKCALLDEFSIGNEVEVAINLRGVCYNDKKTGEEKYFNAIQGWKIAKTDGAPEPKGAGSPMKSHAEAMEERRNAKESASIENQDVIDDLPF